MKDHVQRSLEDMVLNVLRQLTSSDVHERNNVHVTLPNRNKALNFVGNSQSLTPLNGDGKEDHPTTPEFGSDSTSATGDENGKFSVRKVKFRSMKSAKTFGELCGFIFFSENRENDSYSC